MTYHYHRLGFSDRVQILLLYFGRVGVGIIPADLLNPINYGSFLGVLLGHSYLF